MKEHQIDEGQLASALLRLAGFLLDTLFLVVIAAVLSIVLGISPSAESDDLPLQLRILQGLTGALYYVAFTAWRGQTPGKMMVGTRVVMADGTDVPGIGASILRWMLPGVFTFFPGVSIIRIAVYALVPFDDRRRGLHDRLAKTLVIRAR